MKLKFLLSLCLAGALTASAQSQGYKDGVEYFKAGQYDNAKEILERTLNDASTDKAIAYYYLGAIQVQNKNYDEAKKLFEQGLSVNPESAFNMVGLGEIALFSGDTKTA
ncbi:MAG: tetratricopeptide repeat protein, partial [Muribaculaceae bacterium]|nr:tetratricopeptide repeat protein [Muribaculaceae bacterium]